MRTSLRTSDGMPGIPYYQGGFYPHKYRGGEKKEKSPAPKRGNNGFLTGRILPVVSPEVKLSTDQGEINVATAENYRHLLACTEHYAKLTWQSLNVKKGRNHSHSISLLYDALDTLIPQHLNIEEDEGKLHFLLFDYQYDPDQREEQDYPPMELERIVLLAYDTDDRVNEDMIDCANSELRESYALSPVTTRLLTTDLREPFQKDDYPERFCKWFTGFTSFINDNF